MLFQSRTVVIFLAVSALSAAVLALAIDHSDAGRGGGRGGGGFRGGGGGFGGGARISNGFHHRPPGGGNYHRPGGSFGGGAHVDNSLPGRPAHGRPDRPDRPDRPATGRAMAAIMTGQAEATITTTISAGITHPTPTAWRRGSQSEPMCTACRRTVCMSSMAG